MNLLHHATADKHVRIQLLLVGFCAYVLCSFVRVRGQLLHYETTVCFHSESTPVQSHNPNLIHCTLESVLKYIPIFMINPTQLHHLRIGKPREVVLFERGSSLQMLLDFLPPATFSPGSTSICLLLVTHGLDQSANSSRFDTSFIVNAIHVFRL